MSAAGPRGPPPHSVHPKIIFWYDNRTRGGRKRQLASISKDREEGKNRARCKLVVWPHSLALNEMACKGNGTLMNMHVPHYLFRPRRVGLLRLMNCLKVIRFCQVAPEVTTGETMTWRTFISNHVETTWHHNILGHHQNTVQPFLYSHPISFKCIYFLLPGSDRQIVFFFFNMLVDIHISSSITGVIKAPSVSISFWRVVVAVTFVKCKLFHLSSSSWQLWIISGISAL